MVKWSFILVNSAHYLAFQPTALLVHSHHSHSVVLGQSRQLFSSEKLKKAQSTKDTQTDTITN